MIYLSQSANNPSNLPYNVPGKGPNFVIDSPLVYSTTLFTSLETGNTPFDTTLMAINSGGVASPQAQMWHRMNTSLIGDTVQLGFTLSDAQMRDTNFSNQFVEIELHGMVIDVFPSQLLC